MDDPPSGARAPAWCAAGLVSVAVGLLMLLLPYSAWSGRMGRPYYIADNDELLYLTVAAPAAYHHPTALSDPSRAADRRASDLEPPPGFVPGIVLAPGAPAGTPSGSAWPGDSSPARRSA